MQCRADFAVLQYIISTVQHSHIAAVPFALFKNNDFLITCMGARRAICVYATQRASWLQKLAKINVSVQHKFQKREISFPL